MNEFDGLRKKKENKKKGFLAWLRERLGFSPKGMGNLSEGARDINLAGIRGAGTAGRFGSGGLFGLGGRGTAGGLFSFLGGKGVIVTLALVGLAVAATLYYRNADNSNAGYSSMGDSKIASYVPKILREQNNESTLDMFREANKGAIKTEEDTQKVDEEKPKEPEEQPPQNQSNLQSNLGFDNKPRLQTDMQFGLSNGVGDGSNKFSALGGFGNQMGKFGPSVKGDFNKNDLLSAVKSATGGKLSAMKSQKRPVIAQGAKFNSAKGGKRAFDQAKAVKSMQLAPNYGKADTARYNLDRAWEGGTGGSGSVEGGSGTSDGGSGVVQTPSSLDNIGDTGGINPNTEVPNVPGYKFDTPWASLLQKAMMLLMISALLSGIAGMLAKTWIGKIGATIIAAIAAIMAIMVIVIGMKIMSTYGQHKLGMIYVIGGGLALAAAIAAIGGINFGWNILYSQLLAAAAGILGMFASMAAGPK